MARQRRGRPVSGILLLNKPAEMSSNGAMQVARRLYGAAKAGHTGSLDPLATGMLPVCFGEATKFSQYLLDANKSYSVTAKLGITTTTSDADGEVVETHEVNVSASEIERELMTFVGDIEQLPSMYSALKHQGQPLYKLARKGIEIERKTRQVTIFAIRVMAVRSDEVDFEVDCSKGTYVRSLVEDLGAALGCGGHVQRLHRISAGSFATDKMLTLDQLREIKEQGDIAALDALLLPADTSVLSLPAVTLTDTAAFYLLRGQAVQVSERPQDGEVRLYRGSDSAFLGVGEVNDEGLIAPRRLVAN